MPIKNIVGWWETITKIKTNNTFFPHLPSSQAQVCSHFFTSPTLQCCRGMGDGGCGQFITQHLIPFTPSSSCSFSAPVQCCFHRKQSFMNSSSGPLMSPSPTRSAPSCVLSTGYSPSGTACSSMDHLWVQRSCWENLLRCGLHSTGHLLWHGVLHRLQCGYHLLTANLSLIYI